MIAPRTGWPAPAAPGTGPLAGVRVLDLTRILAGPLSTMLLSDLGADVLKVESPGQGDETRRWGPPFTPDGVTTYFLAINRNKRSVTLDLGDDEAGEIARRLAASADVVVDNFLPGRLARFGLDPAAIRASNPAAVTATITGFATGSTREGRPGFDLLAQAMGGMMATTGRPDGPPEKVGVAIADVLCGLHLTSAILAALVERERTGRGQHVEVALLDAQVASLANLSSAWLNAGAHVTRRGDHHPSVAPYGSFATADRRLVIAVGNDQQFVRLVETLGVPGLATDPRFATNAARVDHRDELTPLLEEQLGLLTRDDALARLVEAGVPAGPINEVAEVFEDPDIAARLVREVDGVRQVLSPARFDGEPPTVRTAPPALGQHTDEVLAALGVDGPTRDAWRQRNAI